MAARRRGGDRGVISISLALVFPAVLFLVMLVAQIALAWYTNSIALAAARAGADAGRFRGSTPEVAQKRAQDFLAPFGGLVGSTTVDPPNRTADSITVTVHVHPLLLLPGIDAAVTQSASAPVEKYVFK